MPIYLRDIWPIQNPGDYKVHFGRWNKQEQPLEAWTRERVGSSNGREDRIPFSRRCPYPPIYDASAIDTAWRQVVVEQFHLTPRPDPTPFLDGDVFDLGGGVRIRVIHAPGHTRGHSFFHVEPDDVLYLGDVALSSFGPYYGDAWSSLNDFERRLADARTPEARWPASRP